jgi:AraC family transcriptional regulator
MAQFRFLSSRDWSIYPPRNFTRMFKASTGITPHRYQLNTRIEKAKNLLLTKGESPSMVAATTGFVDQSHFTRTFRRVTGTTPHEWRQNRTSWRMG